MTKKRLQKKVKKQAQEIYVLQGIIKRTIVCCNELATVDFLYTDGDTRYLLTRLAQRLEERLDEVV